MDNKDIIAVIGNQDKVLNLPKIGGRKIQIVNIVKMFNNVGYPVIYIEYDYHGTRWGLTYKADDHKLNKIFPDGVIRLNDIGRYINVEIDYCDSKNGPYPSVLGLEPDEQ